jgi:hypothetical protein
VRPRRAWLYPVGLAVIALLGLLAAGLQGLPRRTYTLNAPSQRSVALLRETERVCEGPVSSSGPARAVGIWGRSIIGPARLEVGVQDARTGTLLTEGELEGTIASHEYTARLTRTVPGGQPLRVCLTGQLNTFSLLGSTAAHPNIVMSGNGHGNNEFSLVLLSDDHSLLSSLPTAFSRAALFRPGWVGSWTFWLLATALLATFGLGVVAVMSAGRDDESC